MNYLPIKVTILHFLLIFDNSRSAKNDGLLKNKRTFREKQKDNAQFSYARNKRLINGTRNIEIAEYPYAGSLLYKSVFTCSTVLVSSNLALTAAHCEYWPATTILRKIHYFRTIFGTNRLPKECTVIFPDFSSEPPIERRGCSAIESKVLDIIVNPLFDIFDVQSRKSHDIALLVIEEILHFNRDIFPITSFREPFIGIQGHTATFGATEIGVPTQWMRIGKHTIVNSSFCEGKLISTPKTFCVECHNCLVNGGDSGGVFVWKLAREGKSDIAFALGILNSRDNDCPKYATFTKISFYAEWINKNIAKNRIIGPAYILRNCTT